MAKATKRGQKPPFALKKSLGQNFLLDKALLDELVEAAGVTETDAVLEIGPGSGSLTVALARRARKVIAVELDQQLAPMLNEAVRPYPHVQLVWADALEADLDALVASLGAPCRLVANLPYYITTPLLMRVLTEGLPLAGIAVMVQAEVGEKLLAGPGQAGYGPLSIWTQIFTTPREALRVPAEAFTPKPKVDSSFMVLEPRVPPLVTPEDQAALSRLLRIAFAMKRKTLRNNLQAGFALSKERAEDALGALGFSKDVRAEQIAPESLVSLAILLKRGNFS